MSANQLHHLHLRDQVCQILVGGIVCKDDSQGDYISETLGWGQDTEPWTQSQEGLGLNSC